MEYQIGDFSRIVGLSADTIKHYERQNIVEPSRRGENGYRSYCESDAITYTMIRMLRGFEISVPQIHDLRRNSTIEQVDASLEKKERELVELIKRSEKLLGKVRYVRKSFTRIAEELGHCVIRTIPEIYRLQKTKGGKILLSPGVVEATRKMMDSLPYSYFSIRVSLESFLGESPLTYNWGLGITKEDFEMLGLENSGEYDYSPASRIASTIIVKDTLLPVTRDDLAQLRAFVLEQGFRLKGEVMIRLLSEAHPGGNTRYYYSIIVPIE